MFELVTWVLKSGLVRFVKNLQVAFVEQHIVHLLFHPSGFLVLLVFDIFKLQESFIVVIIVEEVIVLSQELIELVHPVKLRTLWTVTWALVVLEVQQLWTCVFCAIFH